VTFLMMTPTNQAELDPPDLVEDWLTLRLGGEGKGGV
jgi:hypothetical protein